MKTKAKAEEQDFQAVTDSYARRVIASMRDDLEALKHAQECNGMTEDEKPCQRGRETEDVRQPGGPTVPGMSNRERFIHETPKHGTTRSGLER